MNVIICFSNIRSPLGTFKNFDFFNLKTFFKVILVRGATTLQKITNTEA